MNKYTARMTHAKDRPCTHRTRIRGPIWALAAMVLSAGLGGCAHPAKTESGGSSPTAITAGEARSVIVLDGASGRRVSWDVLVSAAAGADAVLIGENHGHPLGLAATAALWEDVLKRTNRAALALEFFERDEQSRLDDYLNGICDEATFRKRTARSESNYPPGHRAMVEAAKAAHRPVISMNCAEAVCPRGSRRRLREIGNAHAGRAPALSHTRCAPGARLKVPRGIRACDG